MSKALYTREETMEYLRVSSPTLWRLEQAKKLRPVRIGRRVLYRAADLERFLDRQMKTAAAR